MTELLNELRAAYREGGVASLAAEAERCMPPDGGHGWVDELVAGCSDPEYSVPASWLLLQHGRNGRAIPVASLRRLVSSSVSTDAGPNDARLHLAQLVQYLEIPAASAKALASFLLRACESEHTFLRAWAMDGLYRLSLQHPKFAEAAERALLQGADDPKTSVRARSRRIAAESAKRKAGRR